MHLSSLDLSLPSTLKSMPLQALKAFIKLCKRLTYESQSVSPGIQGDFGTFSSSGGRTAGPGNAHHLQHPCHKNYPGCHSNMTLFFAKGSPGRACYM